MELPVDSKVYVTFSLVIYVKASQIESQIMKFGLPNLRLIYEENSLLIATDHHEEIEFPDTTVYSTVQIETRGMVIFF
jgi:hypothetical protein